MVNQGALLTLLVALLSGQASFQAVNCDQLPELAALANYHGLGPMLYWSAKQAGLDEAYYLVAKEAVHSAAVHEALLSKTLVEVNTALTQAGIPALWLKGAALARTVYPHPYLRSMNDLDVLVPFEQRQDALRILQGLGYHFPEEQNSFIAMDDEMIETLSHHYHLSGGVGGLVTLELHYQLLGNAKQLLSKDQLKWFWSQTLSITSGDTTFATLRPEAHLLFLCAHALLQHGEIDFYLQRFFDIHLLTKKTTLDWHLITSQAEMLDWSAAVARGLELTTTYFGSPVPVDALSRLQQQIGKNTFRVVMLQGAEGSRWEKVFGRLGDFSAWEKVQFVCRVAAPPRSYMRKRYKVPENRSITPYYLYRWADQARDAIYWSWRWLTRRR